jgi:alanyl-tRNA synthetase
LVAVTEDWVKEGLKAGDLVKALARIVGGGGGGRPTLATAGGPNAEALPQALAEAPALIKGALEK